MINFDWGRFWDVAVNHLIVYAFVLQEGVIRVFYVYLLLAEVGWDVIMSNCFALFDGPWLLRHVRFGWFSIRLYRPIHSIDLGIALIHVWNYQWFHRSNLWSVHDSFHLFNLPKRLRLIIIVILFKGLHVALDGDLKPTYLVFTTINSLRNNLNFRASQCHPIV